MARSEHGARIEKVVTIAERFVMEALMRWDDELFDYVIDLSNQDVVDADDEATAELLALSRRHRDVVENLVRRLGYLRPGDDVERAVEFVMRVLAYGDAVGFWNRESLTEPG
jgi:hypothetical protein